MIFNDSGFGKSVGILEKSLNANRLRARVVGNNLANVETPNFKRSDVNFESELKRAIDNEPYAKNALVANKTMSGHMDFAKPVTWDRVESRLQLDYLSEVKQNGNNVDLERETQEAAKNNLAYMMLTDATKFQFNQIALVVKG